MIIHIFKFTKKIFHSFINRNLLILIKSYLNKDIYKKINILNKDIFFLVPNRIIYWRIKTFFTKEPETLEWIDSFDNKDNLIFWDIGANIGLYSIYNSLKNPNSTTIAFEPSSSNLRVLTRNISINNLEKKIKLFPIPLTNKDNIFQIMHEGEFQEGGALNSFGEKFDFEGKMFEPKMKYTLFGTSINYLLNSAILDIPDHIKIDVDGIEHLILEGGNKFLTNKRIKSMSIEINENFKDQFEKILELMKIYEFRVLHKKNSGIFKKESKFSKTYNYVFVR